MAKINSVRDLPDWFDLGKYKEAESFGAAEWLGQLTYRMKLRRRLLMPSWIWQFETREDAIARELLRLSLNPIELFPGDMAHFPSLGSPIADIKMTDLWLQARRDRPHNAPEKCDTWEAKRWIAIAEGTKIKGFQFNELVLTPLEGGPGHPCIKVDLQVADAVLKKSFDQWLRHQRKTQPRNVANPKNEHYSRWARNGLLPYLDLSFWAMMTKNDIPDRVMSAALNRHDHEVGESNIRKNVAVLAKRLMRDLTHLKAQAANEALERA
jgi:hypothetical protein